MNISNLLSLTCAPELYEPGTHLMWDDHYISEQLLHIHLDQSTDAASRRITTVTKTVRWIESHLEKSSMILDLGCGPGLYDEFLTELGHTVTGVDYSHRSIEYAKSQAAEKGLEITYLNQDYLNMTLDNRFDLVIMIYCDFSVLIPGNRDRLLHHIVNLLNPGGLFIFDILNEHSPEIMNIGKKDWDVSEQGFWRPYPYLALSQSFHYPDQHVILEQHAVCSDQSCPEIYRFWNHYYQTEEMKSILKTAGFSEVRTSDQVLPDDAVGQNKMVTFYTAQKSDTRNLY
ncbi:class I SAM-dependent methyltransferase [uncultured Methanospirillum sp.]|uniref:class I SAM-dependent methyltransferase n=1 Tax=uncultured Methanospirillum sp. TaxID=262503 RepID=UPI0029C9321E|nr:class I SAM-dependent methyltransferase [uncultured Methanospirillum sp.]